MTKFTATFSDGTVATHNSKTRAFTHAVRVTRNGEGRGTFFASSLELAQKRGQGEVSRIAKFDPSGLAFEVVAVSA